MTPERARVVLDHAREILRPEEYRLVEAWANLLLYVKERAVKGDVTEEELCRGIRERCPVIVESSKEPGPTCPR
jgi:hypothetical protein